MSELRSVYEGGCHCGAVRFRVRLRDPAAARGLDCNCSVCRKKGFLHLIVTRDEFELVRGADQITTYTFNTHAARHMFCRTCGMHPFYIPRSHPDGFDVNIRCLDDESPPFPIDPFDGRRWEENIDRIR